MKKYATAKQFAEASDGDRAGLILLGVGSVIKKADDGTKSRTVRFRFSDATRDRMGDIIEPKGWVLKDFRKSPVALLNHDPYSLPIGKCGNLTVTAEAFDGDVTFADAETYPLADTVFRLVSGGFMKACSVGFIPIKYEPMKDAETDRFIGYRFTKQSLNELSVVSVPANPSCLVQAKSAGINVRALRADYTRQLDGWDESPMGLVVPRSHVEAAYKATSEMTVKGATFDNNDDNDNGDDHGDDQGNGGDIDGTRDGGDAADGAEGMGAAGVVRARGVGAGDGRGGASGDEALHRDGTGAAGEGVQCADDDTGADDDGSAEGGAARTRAAADTGADEGGREAEGADEGEGDEGIGQVTRNVTRTIAGVKHVFEAATGRHLGTVGPDGALTVDTAAQVDIAERNLATIRAARAARRPGATKAVPHSRRRAELAMRVRAAC